MSDNINLPVSKHVANNSRFFFIDNTNTHGSPAIVVIDFKTSFS